MELTVFLLIIILLIVLLRCRKLSKKLEVQERIFQEDIAMEAWLHESNLKLLQKAVKNRITSLDSHAKMLDIIAKDKIADAKEEVKRTRTSCNQRIEELSRYKVWKVTVKTGMERMAYPDRLIVIADEKETAKQLIETKFQLDDALEIYNIVQSRRNKNEILLESYDIL